MGIILLLIYEVWAVFAGYRVMTDRIDWLEEPNAVNQIVKFVVCFFVGNLVGAFYLLYLIVMLIIGLAS